MFKQLATAKQILPERKVWTQEEDVILRNIVATGSSQKWSEIAKIMETDHSILGRTGKQCRERWHNQLDPNIKNEIWSEDEENLLFQYHNQFGNKWAKIAQMLPGRTDNCIKNHFYCTLRKALRRINKYINLPKNKGKYKEIKNLILSKIIAVAQEKFERKLEVPEELIETCCDIKNKLIRYSKDIDTEQEQHQQELIELITSIMDFNKVYKRKKNRKKPTKTQTNKSSAQDSLAEDEEEADQINLPDNKRSVSGPLLVVPVKSLEVPVPVQPDTQKPVATTTFHKKPSLRSYLLTPSMQMQLQDRLKPDQTSKVLQEFTFQPSSPPRMDGTSSQLDPIFKAQFTIPQRGFTPVTSNPIWGELRKIQSFDYENYRKNI